jgi:hypothetical protein
MNNKIFSAKFAIEAMKNSGYKDAAHSIAELIDNSIQAGERNDKEIEVEVICIEQEQFIQDRSSSRIDKIAVYDNASGMTPEILGIALTFGQGTRRGATKGMGKFGIGLPNASIAQGNRVDVWSWQKKGEYYHTYLDLDEIVESDYDEIPNVKLQENIPREWEKKITSKIGESGTLVVWSRLERLKWRRHKAFFSNTEFIVGRMYRYFIDKKKCCIRMSAYADEKKVYNKLLEQNDPLYLMSSSSTPEPYKNKQGFEPFGDDGEFPIKINWEGEIHTVKLRISIARADFRRELAEQRKNAGDTPFGKHCAKNQGISVVRADREIELSHAFDIHYDPVERWWGIEIAFDPALDEVFGVTNNKQAATAFRQLSFSDVALEEDKLEGEVRTFLKSENDIRLPIIEISNEISSKLATIRRMIKMQTDGVKAKNKAAAGGDEAGKAATSVTERDGKKGLSDKIDEKLTREEKENEISEAIKSDGIEIDEAGEKTIIESWLNDSKYIFTSAEIRSSRVIFDISQPAGKIKITLNSKHPAYEHFIKKIEEEDAHSFNTLKLLFAAWARMEDIDSQSEERKNMLEDIRVQWGQIGKDMIDEYIK